MIKETQFSLFLPLSHHDGRCGESCGLGTACPQHLWSSQGHFGALSQIPAQPKGHFSHLMAAFCKFLPIRLPALPHTTLCSEPRRWARRMASGNWSIIRHTWGKTMFFQLSRMQNICHKGLCWPNRFSLWSERWDLHPKRRPGAGYSLQSAGYKRHGSCTQPALSLGNTNNLGSCLWRNKEKLAYPQSGLLFLYTMHHTTAVFTISLPQSRCKSLQMPANLPFHFHVNSRSQQSYRRAYYAFPNVNLCSFEHQQKSHVYLKVGCNPLSALHLTADRMACPHEDFRKQWVRHPTQALGVLFISFASVQPVDFS